MSPKFFLRAAVAAAMLATGLAAQAGTVTLTSYKYGQNNVNVTLSSPNTPKTYNSGAGAFTATLSGFAGYDGSYESYCVDLYEYFTPGQAYSGYTLLNADSYFDAAKAETLGKLIGYGTGLIGAAAAGMKDDVSTALQLAIWEVVYDSNATLDSGPFRDGGSFRAQANSLLSASAGYSGAINYELFVLSSGRPLGTAAGQQDQLIWKESPSRRDLPEPASLALVGLALGGAAFASRRRRA